jgi:hypothetical protein
MSVTNANRSKRPMIKPVYAPIKAPPKPPDQLKYLAPKTSPDTNPPADNANVKMWKSEIILFY